MAKTERYFSPSMKQSIKLAEKLNKALNLSVAELYAKQLQIFGSPIYKLQFENQLLENTMSALELAAKIDIKIPNENLLGLYNSKIFDSSQQTISKIIGIDHFQSILNLMSLPYEKINLNFDSSFQKTNPLQYSSAMDIAEKMNIHIPKSNIWQEYFDSSNKEIFKDSQLTILQIPSIGIQQSVFRAMDLPFEQFKVKIDSTFQNILKKPNENFIKTIKHKTTRKKQINKAYKFIKTNKFFSLILWIYAIIKLLNEITAFNIDTLPFLKEKIQYLIQTLIHLCSQIESI